LIEKKERDPLKYGTFQIYPADERNNPTTKYLTISKEGPWMLQDPT